MKTTKKQLKEIQAIEKKVANVCDNKLMVKVTRNDEGVIINTETGEPHFKELLEHFNDKIELFLIFDESAPSLKKQIKEQGWLLSNKHFKGAEKLRKQLNNLLDIGILKEKEAHKCFKRLNKMLCEAIEETFID